MAGSGFIPGLKTTVSNEGNTLPLDFSKPSVPATATQPTTYNINTNEILGLTDSSKYPSLQQVGDTGYYYRDNYMYEPYTITQSAPSYGMGGFYGYGMGSGGSNRAEGTIEIGGQAFRPVTDASVSGFTAFEPESGPTQYTPSMAYLYANSPKYVPKPIDNVGIYAAAGDDYVSQYGIGPQPGFLDQNPVSYFDNPRTSYGAGRFLNDYMNKNSSLLNFNTDSVYDTTGSNTESS